MCLDWHKIRGALQLSQSIQHRASQEYSGKLKSIVEFFETLFPPSPDLINNAAAFIDNSVWGKFS
jgi:hypothetical protein